MKTLIIGLMSAGILVAGVMEYRSIRREAVVTIGDIETPLLPPRLRVRNLHGDNVDVFYTIAADGELHRLGSVPMLATLSFPLPEGLGAMQIVVEVEGSGERFTSRQIVCGDDADIGLDVIWPIGESRVDVSRLDVIRTLSVP